MKKRSIALIIGLMGFALLGVMGTQFYFLRQSYQMQSELFDRSVNTALDNVVAKIGKQDALNFLNVRARRSGFTNSNGNLIAENASGDSAIKVKHKLTARERKIALLRDSLRRMILHKKVDDEISKIIPGGTINLQLHYEEFTDMYGVVHGRVVPELVPNKISANQHLKLHKYDTLRYTYIDPQFGKQ